MTDLTNCEKCGSPILGNETFCSNCGRRVRETRGTALRVGDQNARRVRILVTILAVLVLLGAAGLYFRSF